MNDDFYSRKWHSLIYRVCFLKQGSVSEIYDYCREFFPDMKDSFFDGLIDIAVSGNNKEWYHKYLSER